MKWLQDNPLGMALAGISGVFVLIMVALGVAWSLPVSVETTQTASQESSGEDGILVAHEAGPLSEFQVINEKPVFNESRLPVISDGDESLEDDTVAIKGAPEVRLTGVIITPEVKIASLTPNDSELEGVMAHEGQSLIGEYAGWQVSSINPRNVVLESRDGQEMELELEVHDATIKEPPKPEPAAKSDTRPGEAASDEDEQPLSRAEQIRQRIAERRAELRREQEEQQEQTRPEKDQSKAESRQPSKPKDYQSAIRSLMNNKSKDQDSDDNNDG